MTVLLTASNLCPLGVQKLAGIPAVLSQNVTYKFLDTRISQDLNVLGRKFKYWPPIIFCTKQVLLRNSNLKKFYTQSVPNYVKNSF